MATDCNDSEPSTYPGATEVPDDGIDQDCNGFDELSCYVDSDNDGYGDDSATSVQLTTAADCLSGGESAVATDCDDADPDNFPTNTEVCDGQDNDCTGGADFSDGTGDELDDDGDSWLDCDAFVSSSLNAGGFVGGGDCDDEPAACGAACNPALSEVCDDYDNNCTGGIDEGCDDDLDGYCDDSMTVLGDPGVCPMSATDVGDDCDDADSLLALLEDWYADCDGDGEFETVATSSCGIPSLNCLDGAAPDGGWSPLSGSDCDDEDATAFTGCDGVCSTTPCASCGCGGLCNGPTLPPAVPGAVTGPASVCPGTGGYVYSIAPYAGVTSYDWTVPPGATVTAGQGTDSVTVTYGATMGDVSVTAANACAASPPSTLAVSASLDATGGAITDVGGRRIHTFTTVGPFSFTVLGGCSDAEVLVVGGGGKGGTSGGGGGGGGGHVLHETTFALAAGAYSGFVGSGKTVVPDGYSGGDLGGAAQASSFDVLVAAPGTNGTGPGGDSGNIIDGVATNYTGGAVLASPSNGGGAGAGSNGGDGSSSPGGTSGSGGDGLSISISGAPTWYGGGGGAGSHCGSSCPGVGAGGQGGGGAGAQGGSCSGCFPAVGNSGSPALPNTGGGGGGGGGRSGCCHGYGGSGGSGIVIISYTR